MIKYKRIALRHVIESDLPALAQVLTDPQTRGLYNPTRMGSPHGIEKRFRDDGFSNDEHEMLLVCDASGAVIGDVLHFRARRYSSSREIGWTIHNPVHRNQGYATEAVTALVVQHRHHQPCVAASRRKMRLHPRGRVTRAGICGGRLP